MTLTQELLEQSHTALEFQMQKSAELEKEIQKTKALNFTLITQMRKMQAELFALQDEIFALQDNNYRVLRWDAEAGDE